LDLAHPNSPADATQNEFPVSPVSSTKQEIFPGINIGASMSNLVEFASQLAKTWGTKTLEELRVEAEHEATGIRYECIRADGGQRFIIVMCLTDMDQIARLERAIELVDDGLTEDWNTLTLGHVAIRTTLGDGFGFESLRDEYGRRSVVVLIAADPRSIHIIETVFELPR
jgi:hypothetical protein